MGLSTKQVHGDGLDWSEALCQAQTFQVPKAPSVRRQQQHQNQQQQQPEACPRCESTNTKFCYYNNYNKSQPRHFCRACKRHWTKGGTLRNVPVGGGRKNKRRPRKSSTTTSHDSAATATTTTTTTTTRLNNTHMAIDQTDPDHMSEALYQALIRPPSSLPPQNLNTMSSSQLGNNNDIIFSSSSSSGLSTLPFLQSMNLRFPFSSSTTSTSFDTSLPSISTSFQSSNVYNPYCEEFKAMEEPTITTTTDQPNWKVPATISTGSGMDIMSNDWNWEDIETLVSTDLNVPWDDSDHVKP